MLPPEQLAKEAADALRRLRTTTTRSRTVPVAGPPPDDAGEATARQSPHRYGRRRNPPKGGVRRGD